MAHIPELDPDTNGYKLVLSPTEHAQRDRHSSELAAIEFLTEFRGGDHDEFRSIDDPTRRTLTGITPLNPRWRSELLFLLTIVEGTTLRTLCRLVQTTTTQLFAWRKEDTELDDAVKAFQAATFEHAAETPGHGLAPAVINFGLEARASWRRRLELTIDVDQVGKVVDEVIEVVARIVKDPEQIALIVSELERRDLPRGVISAPALTLPAGARFAGADLARGTMTDRDPRMKDLKTDTDL